MRTKLILLVRIKVFVSGQKYYWHRVDDNKMFYCFS